MHPFPCQSAHALAPQPKEQHAYPIFCDDWGADEELLLIDGCQIYGVGNWADIADHIGNRSKEEVEKHYVQVFLEGKDGTSEGNVRASRALERKWKARRRKEAAREARARGEVPDPVRVKDETRADDESEEEEDDDDEEEELKEFDEKDRKRRSPTPIVGPNMRFYSQLSADEFQASKRRRIESLRETQAAFVPPKNAKPLVSAPTSHSELAGFMPGRLEFDLEYEQDAENLTKDMEFGRVYRFGGDLIKSEHDALGGQKAVQGQARMPPSTRGAIGSRSGTGAGGGGSSANKGTGEGQEDGAGGEGEEKEKDDEEKDEDGDMSMADADDTASVTKDKMKARLLDLDADSNAGTPAPEGTPAPTAPAAAPPTTADTPNAEASTSAAAAAATAVADAGVGGDDKPGDWDEDEADLQLKLTVLDMYNERLDRRARRKDFIFQRNLVDYRRNHAQERRRPKEERDIINRVRHFGQLQTAQDFEDFVNGLCYEDALRRTAAQLQSWRSAGITTLHEGLAFDKERDERRAKAKAIAEGGIAAISHTGVGSGPRQRLEASKAAAARQRDHSVPRDSETSTKGRNPDGLLKLGRKPPQPLDFSKDPNLALLSDAEKALCSTVRVKPAAYLTIKKQILVEHLRRKGKLSRRDCRTLFKMDVNKLGKIYDCIKDEGILDAVSKFGLAGATVDPLPGSEVAVPRPDAPEGGGGSSAGSGSTPHLNGNTPHLNGHHSAPNGSAGSPSSAGRTSPLPPARPTATA